MPIITRLTTLLGIEQPIILAPMDLVSNARLATAVSAAGGLGLIGGGYGEEAWLKRELSAVKDERIGVGFITWSLAKQPHLLDLALEYRPVAVMLSFGDVTPFASRIKAAGARLICQVQTVAQAKAALAAGADVLVAQGSEAGGHGMSRGTFALVPAVVDIAGGVPVAAAGGVSDGRGLAAALMFGADGVLVGTRFYATEEAGGFIAAKEAIRDARGDSTIRSSSSTSPVATSGPAASPVACSRTSSRRAGAVARPSYCRMQRRSKAMRRRAPRETSAQPP